MTFVIVGGGPTGVEFAGALIELVHFVLAKDYPELSIQAARVGGYLAWLVWLLLHLYYLIGFRNRIVVMLNWVWYYWFHERQVRLITRREADRDKRTFL
jgi:NADH dehydrogenase FAD-containing subunit